MKDLVTMVSDWWSVKCAKNPNPDLEQQIRDERRKLHEQVALLRLTQNEIKRDRKNLRFQVIDELINDVARR